MWYAEAGKYDVFPIDASAAERLMTERPQIAEPRDQLHLPARAPRRVPFWVGPRVLNRPHSITADAEIPDGGAEGVLICQGSNAGGWTFYVQDDRLHYAHNYVGREIYRVSAPDRLPAGRHQLRFEFEPTGKPDFAAGKGAPGPGPAVRRRPARRQQRVPGHHADRLQPRRPHLRRQPGLARSSRTTRPAPFPFTGTLHTVTIDLSGDLITDTESEMRMAMARQ